MIESDRAADDPPCDFVVHLAQRLGVDRDAAQARLHQWLARSDTKAASTSPAGNEVRVKGGNVKGGEQTDTNPAASAWPVAVEPADSAAVDVWRNEGDPN